MLDLLVAGSVVLFLDQWSKRVMELRAGQGAVSVGSVVRIRDARNMRGLYSNESVRIALVLLWLAALVSGIVLHRGEFRYAKLVPADPMVEHVKLTAGREYYIMTMEMTGGDQFYGRNTIVETRTEAAVLSAVYSDTATPGVYTEAGMAGNTIGPVSFQY